MQSIKLSLLCAGLLVPALNAQGGTGWIDQDTTTAGNQPFKASTYFKNSAGTTADPSIFDITTPAKIWPNTAGTIQQCSLGKTGTTGTSVAGVFHMCMTVTNLNSFYGGVGSSDVIMGEVSWNSGKPVFTPTTLANNMNVTGAVFGLMVDDKDGRLAAVDHPSGPVLADRSVNLFPFNNPVAVSGAGGPYIDPAVAYVEGTTGPVLFFIRGTGIVYSPLALTGAIGSITAAAVTAANDVPVVSGLAQAHSFTPITNAAGNAQGGWFSTLTGSDSDMMVTGTIDNGDRAVEWNTTGWLNNGGVAGGRFFSADAGASYNNLNIGQGYYLTANSPVTVGSGAMLKLGTGGQSGTPPLNTSTIALSLASAPPFAIPGFLGGLAVTTTPIFLTFGGPTSSNTDDTAEMSLPASDASLKNATLYFQALIAPTDTSLQPALTNEVKVRFL